MPDPEGPFPSPPPLPLHPPTSRRQPVIDPDSAPSDPRVFACSLPCIHCAYDLRTIPVGTRCPECGKPGADSLRSLALALPEDIARVRRSLVLLAIAGLCAPLLGLMIALVFLLSAGSARGEEGVAYLLGTAALAVGPIMSAVACENIARPIRRQDIPDIPALDHPYGGMFARPVLVAAGSFLVFCILLGFTLLVLANSHSAGRTFEIAAATLGILTLLAWDVRNLLLCRLLGALCGHANFPGTRRAFHILWGVAIGLGGGHLAAGLFALAAEIHPRLFEELFNASRRGMFLLGITFQVGVAVIEFGAFIWIIAWPIMLLRMYRGLKRPLTLASAAQQGILAAPANPDAQFFSPPSPAPGGPIVPP